MTNEFGPDISSYQNGLDLSRLAFASFVIAKTTEGTGYTDANYPGWRAQAAALRRLFIWYHFLSGQDAAAQVAHTRSNVGDTTLPGMLDFEPTGSYSPTLAQALAYVDAAHAAGLNLRLVYLPRWYWATPLSRGGLGSPDLSGFRARGVQLVSSSYPGGQGTPDRLYPGDNAAGWQPYYPGAQLPLIYQFTNQATDGGQSLDYNAFRGTLAELASALNIPTPTGGTNMPDGVIPPTIASQDPDLPQIPGMFPANQPFSTATAAIWGDERAAAANLRIQRAQASIDAIAQKLAADDADAATHLQEIGSTLSELITLVHTLGGAVTGGGGVDVAALAAALAPELASHLTLATK